MVKGAKIYVLVTQSFLQMIVLMYIGYKLGTSWWLESTTWGAIFCAIGAVIGLVTMIITVMKAGDASDERKDIQ